MNFETKVGSALHIAKDVFDELEMGVLRIMHKEAHLLDCIGEVGTCEGKILEGIGETSVEARVRKGGPM
jgi:hypothetical protein